MTAFTLKIIALTTMIIDHIGVAFPEFFGFESGGTNIFRVIGRVAFPVFVYLVAEGFRHTKSPAKFLVRLGVFAIISEPVFDLFFGNGISFLQNTNIFYTLLLGGAAIAAYKRIKDFLESEAVAEAINMLAPVMALLPVIGFMLLAEMLTSDYGAYGVLFIVSMYVINHVKFRLAAMALFCIWQHIFIVKAILLGFFVHIPTLQLLMIPATLIPVALIAFYNGKRGKNLKWFFYFAYPVHLAALFALDTFLLLY